MEFFLPFQGTDFYYLETSRPLLLPFVVAAYPDNENTDWNMEDRPCMFSTEGLGMRHGLSSLSLVLDSPEEATGNQQCLKVEVI